MAALNKDEQLALVNAFRSGDEQAFARLFRLVDPFLRRHLARIVPPDDVDDVVQDAMINAYTKIDQFQGDAMFSTWCISIGVNIALMRLRKMKREARVIACSIDETISGEEGQVRQAAEFGYEDRAIAQNEAYNLVQRGLESVSEDQRTALLLSLEGASMDEIAETMGVCRSNAKSHLHRGKKAMGAALSASKRKAIAA